jgi:glycosyltransferase involved in cell wall biosynthesis
MIVAVVIPALNEAGNIRALVQDVRRVVPAQVIVVDNGSTDATAAEAEAGGAQVVAEPRRGYGYACQAGVLRAIALRADVVVFMDGDYSFLPAELPRLLLPILHDRADLVLGSRWLGYIAPGAMPPQQRFGNWLASRLMNGLYGTRVTDLGPYRAIRLPLLLSLGMQEMTYGWPTEMMVKAARRGAAIAEVPVSYHPRRAGRSKVSGTVRGTVLAARYILGVTLRYAFAETDARCIALSIVCPHNEQCPLAGLPAGTACHCPPPDKPST